MDGVIIEFLGTGTSQGVPVIACDCAVCQSPDARDVRLRTSAIVRANGATLLIDAGPDLRQQVLRAGIREIDAVLLTHEHMDHVAGIDELRSFNFQMQRPIDIYANDATIAAVRRMFHYAFAEVRYPGAPELRLHSIGDAPFNAGGVEVIPVEVMHHRMPVLGFRIGPMAYITDAKTIGPGALEKLNGVNTLVLNALRKKEHLTHLNLAEALALVERIDPRNTYLTHISHLMGRHADVAAELPQGVYLAMDGLRVTVEV